MWGVIPKLALYQSNSIAGNFFRLLARRKARRIRALQVDTAPRCPIHAQFGPTSYGTGADIIEILAKTYWCTGNQIKELHIFSHGNTDVVAGSEGAERTGIYSSRREQRELGGRSITDIPQEVFASDAAVVFHGCSIASGDDSFAELFLRHLLGTSLRARVYGHSASGVCGRNRDWREFSRRYPEGRRRGRNPYHR